MPIWPSCPNGRCGGTCSARTVVLAAWALGIGSCPNTLSDEAAMRERLEIPAEMSVSTVLSLGYPAPGEPRPRADAAPAAKLTRISRLPLAELLHPETFRACGPRRT